MRRWVIKTSNRIMRKKWGRGSHKERMMLSRLSANFHRCLSFNETSRSLGKKNEDKWKHTPLLILSKNNNWCNTTTTLPLTASSKPLCPKVIRHASILNIKGIEGWRLQSPHYSAHLSAHVSSSCCFCSCDTVTSASLRIERI